MAGSHTSALLGREVPRLWTRPLRELTPETSLGYECIEFAHDVLGMTLLPWQQWLLIHMLELDEDGAFRFRTLCILVARQNGKTTLLQVLSLWRMYVDHAGLVIGTAQDLDVAEETWMGAVELAQGVDELAAEIAHVDKTNGKKALRLKTGERYKVKAASRKAGRGLSGDLVALDELREHQTWAAWGAVTKTTMARDRAQIVGLSNAGDANSVVLAHLRRVALQDLVKMGDAEARRALEAFGYGRTDEGEEPPDDLDEDPDESLGIFEWSAPHDCDIADREGWAQANPSLGYTIRENSLRSAMKTDDEAVFRTECLCQWVDQLVPPLFGRGEWESRCDEMSLMDAESVPVVAVEVSIDRAYSSIGAAGRRQDGNLHVELTGSVARGIDHRRGTAWVVPRIKEIQSLLDRTLTVVIDGGGPAASLIPSLKDLTGIELVVLSTTDVTAAAAGAYDAVQQGRLFHLGQPDLDTAAQGARQRTIGDKWGIGRRTSAVDVSPLIAVVNAAWVVETQSVDVMQSIW